MGVIVKYLINFPGAGFRVSNDLLKGDFIIDANIEVSMNRGKAGGIFKIELFDLPGLNASDLGKAKTAMEARVEIMLGYMDGEFETVMGGIYTKVTSQIKGDNLVTTIEGEESGSYALKNKHIQTDINGKIKLEDAVTKLLDNAFSDNFGQSPSSGIPADVASLLGSGTTSQNLIEKVPNVQNILSEFEDLSMKGKNLMDILDNLASAVDGEFLVSDKKVFIGKPIKNNDYQPDELDRDVNLAQFWPITQTLSGEEGDNRLIKLEPYQVLGFKFIITGDPKLRPAQKVSANVKVKGKNGSEVSYRKEDGTEFRIHSLVHKLTIAGGYICEGKAAKECTDDNCRRQQDAIGLGNPDRVVQKLSQQAKDDRRRNPSIEIGTVKQYNSGSASVAPHRNTLYFGQRFPNAETQPSIRAEVENEENQLLRNKPMVSPFAWHKCGLVVPVYPGMKALLTHNLNLPDDALVTGFLWSEKPLLEPPKNKTGDWWLCLPIDFDASQPPKDDTKAVNDLIVNNGKRVIEAKGLKISIGANALKNIGIRPEEGNDDEFLIEHASGAKVLIKDGEIQLSDGKVTLKISGGKVDIS